jgi:gluconokinase
MTPPADAPLVLTLDIGTSSARAMLFDADARPVESIESRRAYSMRTTPDGGVEGDPEALLAFVGETIDEVLARAGPRASRIRAVACCTFWHSLMGIDASGAPVTALYTWADTRAEKEGRELHQAMDSRKYHSRTGAFFHPLYWPAKLRWLRGHPEIGRVKSWMSFGEFLYLKLFGRTLVTVSMASGTGLLDINACAWDSETLAAAGVSADQLQSIGDPTDSFRGLKDPYAARWPALRDLPWTPPVGDGACSNLGSGCATPSALCIMVGTSGAMRVVSTVDRIDIPWGLWCYRADRRRVVLGGALNDGGNLVEWCRRTFRLGEPEEVEREVAAMEPDAHGLTFLPFLAGERSPGWVAHARASIAGLSLDTRPAQILRAGMEAVALRFALLHGMLLESFPQIRQIVTSGGALLKSAAWTQILADALGRPMLPSAEPEASSRGAALITLEALGWIPRLEDPPAAFGPPVLPDEGRHARYGAALKRQQAQYDKLVRELILLLAALLSQAVPGKAWEEKTPADVGLAREPLDALRDLAGGRGCVIRGGFLVYSWGDPSKSVDVGETGIPVLGALLMMAVQEGKLPGVDVRVADVEPRLTGKNAAITWRHLACQVSGYGLEEDPGEAWAANPAALALFHDTLVQKVYGRTGTDILRRSLAEPLGFQDACSFDAGPGRLVISSRDFARFGLLIQRGGAWGSTPILAPSLTYLFISATVPADLPRSSGREGPRIAGQRVLDDGPGGAGSGPGFTSFHWCVNGVDARRRQLFVDGPGDLVAALGQGGRHALWILPSRDLIVSWSDSRIDDRDRSPGNPGSAIDQSVRRMLESVVR